MLVLYQVRYGSTSFQTPCSHRAPGPSGKVPLVFTVSVLPSLDTQRFAMMAGLPSRLCVGSVVRSLMRRSEILFPPMEPMMS
jgi:hypothetical protein